MIRNKFNLFLLNLITIYLLYSIVANEFSEEEYNDSSSSNQVNLLENNEKRQRKNLRKNLWSTDKLAQINKIQNKIFGNEKGILMEFYLDKASQKIILDSYFNENLEFKQAYERYMKTCRTKNETEEPFIQGLCLLYSYGNISSRNLKNYFKMNNVTLLTKLHARKIRFFKGMVGRKWVFNLIDS
uniref:Uncharacterized protein n=1 Tax=Meloidogyne enterolobii TaxID=390850 RepID=A0A6V7TV62_MELEN|nr:unnamed protein product [Meloidogyne enterolobii]